MCSASTSTGERSLAQLTHHYLVEQRLARRLRHAARRERRHLYAELYDQLFREVPDHPQLTGKEASAAKERQIEARLRLLRPFLRSTTHFLEIGPGDCSLAFRVARQVDRVQAVDVSSEITAHLTPPANVELLLSDGCSLPVPPGSVDVVFSDQLMEHLHPDDAIEQLGEIHRALKPGGRYLCITPNRLSGPHDISRHFDDVATGFHLKEYTFGELERLFRQAGFARVYALVGPRGVALPCPTAPLRALESLLQALPRGLARPFVRPLARSLPGRILLNIQLVGVKAA